MSAPIPRNPLSTAAPRSEEPSDEALCARATGGDAAALEELVRRHQRWIHNLALRWVLSPDEAEDLAQDALVRVLTRLSSFEGRSAFRTWAYRVVINCFLDAKKGKMEQAIVSFTAYGQELDRLPLEPLTLSAELEPERSLFIEEAKIGCMLGMLLCLDREQRATYLLGEIFEAPSEIAAAILEITPAAFRKRLERARRDLTAFMNEKCGLVNEANPCRCEKKTRAFIREGWVDPGRLKFTKDHLARLKDSAPERARKLHVLTEDRYAALFREHRLLEGPDLASRLRELLADATLRDTFGLS